MLRIGLAMFVFWMLTIFAGLFGQYGQAYDRISNDTYLKLHQKGDVIEQPLMYWAAEYRCEGYLYEDFSCDKDGPDRGV